MFLKAGALSLALLLASRLLGLLRESAQAAAFGTSGLADVVVLMFTLPDWLTGLLASGALAFVLLPAWAGQSATQVRRSQRTVAMWLMAISIGCAVGLIAFRQTAVSLLAAGLPLQLRPLAAQALMWSAFALPAAILASLWTTRLQHERDFLGMYAANLVVNGALVGVIALVALQSSAPIHWLGLGLVSAMALRLLWLFFRQARRILAGEQETDSAKTSLPSPTIWLWAVLGAGLPLTLPFAARSIASQQGEGALATFNYAWKLVELPLVLAIQLAASLSFPAIAAAFSKSGAAAASERAATVRGAFALAWALACAAAGALLIGAPALAHLLFGWGRMDVNSLSRVAQWGAAAAWGLLPQAVIAVATTVLAAQARLKLAVAGYAVALAALLTAAANGVSDGLALVWLLNGLLTVVCLAMLVALGARAVEWLPWRTLVLSLAALLGVAGVAAGDVAAVQAGLVGGLAAAMLAAMAIIGVTWAGSSELRQVLHR